MPQISISDVTGIRIDRNADHELELSLCNVGGQALTLILKPEDPGEAPQMLKRLASGSMDCAVRAQVQLDMQRDAEQLQAIRRMSGQDLAAADTVPTEDVSIAGVES